MKWGLHIVNWRLRAKNVPVSGNVPSGKLVVTGSTCIGGVKACCLGERTISICNVGDCKLNVTSVAFKRKSKHWKLDQQSLPRNATPGLVPERLDSLQGD
jgi:hypothetical protein